MVRLQLNTSPTYTDLISLTTAKSFLRVTHTADDTLITSFITAAIQSAENYTNSRFLETQYTMFMETWDDVYVSNHYTTSLSNGTYLTTGGYVGKDGLNQIVLPYAPLDSITHVKYYDSSNTQQTWTEDTDYSVNTFINQKGFIEITKNTTYPTLYDRADAIEIKFKAGYGTGDSDVPEPIKTAILLILGSMYEKREDSVSRLPKASEYLLDPYRFKTY
tara:strand:- start:3759 stop:4415 length:657 start_codon:yes stop_codon:yes gene_type:complete